MKFSLVMSGLIDLACVRRITPDAIEKYLKPALFLSTNPSLKAGDNKFYKLIPLSFKERGVGGEVISFDNTPLYLF